VIADNLPLLEFDADRSAVVEPSSTQRRVDAPAAAVACFFPEVVAEWAKHARPILELPAQGKLWEVEKNGQRLALFYPGMGSPLAACRLERAIAAGCKVIIACGAAGALDPQLEMGQHVISVSAAIRDEGTSYHYLSPARKIEVSDEIVAVLTEVVELHGEMHTTGVTWTTDAFFRETRSRVSRRRAEGCITVEMEAAALLAVAAFRGVQLGQYLYAGDNLAGAVWDHREWWESRRREGLTELAAEAALTLLQRTASLSQTPSKRTTPA